MKKLVQLGSWEVEQEVLEGPGTSWDDLVSAWLPAEDRMPPRAANDFPSQGWRIVQVSHPTWASEVFILGAPAVADPGSWVLVQLSRKDNDWQFAGSASYVPVPARKERRAGLRLGWAKPSFTMTKGSVPDINVILVNTSAQEWMPTAEDTSHVQGIVINGHGDQVGNGWYVTGSTPSLPAIQPRQSLTLPVFRNNPELEHLQTGDYQILAFLTALDLRTPASARLTVL